MGAAIPTVHEFLNSYRMIYDQIKGYGREATNEAYEKLLDVENRTDDVVEAQIIMEKEHLVLNTVIADYKAISDEFMEAADPNYEVTSAVTEATVGVYATARTIDEITYMGELSKERTSDLAVQTSLKVQLMTTFTGLIFSWEHAKRKIREGDALVDKYAQSMVMTREKIRDYYRFLSEDMGLSFEVMENTPFYRISMLNPSGLDELWRLKKVMHPANIEAIKYILFEEILTDKSMEEILLTPQKAPYFESVNTLKYPEMTDEFQQIAEEMNRDIRFFQRNREEESGGKPASAQDLTGRMKKMNAKLSVLPGQTGGASGGGFAAGGMTGAANGAASALSSAFSSLGGMKKSAGGGLSKDIAKSAAKSAARDLGTGLLKGLFRK
ncbi:MAG: hypothetical protein ACI4LA_03405 [Emergencia sp.]